MSQIVNANSTTLSNTTNSAETIANHEYLVGEFSLHLNVKPLISFRKVSSLWRLLFSSKCFVSRYNRLHPPSLSGLLLVPKYRTKKENDQIEYICLGDQNESVTPVFPFKDMTNVTLLQSSNGLLLYCKGEKYYVFNPSIQEKILLPSCLGDFSPTSPLYCSLAFDPLISQHYKIIGLTKTRNNSMYKIFIYSSESNLWTPSKAPEFSAPRDIDFTSGIYCNGSVHWTKRTKRGLYFDIEKETINDMPENPRQEQYSCEYFGHSKGYLCCLFTMESLPYYELFEMKKDYSAWDFKCKIELDVLASQFPKMSMKTNSRNPHFLYQCHVLSVFRGHNGEFEEIIMSIPGEVIAYNCKEKTSRQIYKSRKSEKEKKIWYGIYQVYDFVESISPVSFLTT
ncbi:F-box protein At5g07610-like [Chenopodium quinoa]|uniref:F-box protein At3g26010-like beta-propeller domain-containing protein n=1 Tax=Chenopodium quinoa TaxID=63459 RepID=A0A803L5F9_CHEQI|nr:F-box protein At5g07610-like [Chenopodium quinoa]